MKKYIVFFLMLFLINNISAQCIVGQPVKVYSWADDEKVFHSNISSKFNGILSKILKDNNIDTVNCQRVGYSEMIRLITKKNYSYSFISATKEKGEIRVDNVHNYNGFSKKSKHKVIIIYRKTDSGDFENVTVYSIK